MATESLKILKLTQSRCNYVQLHNKVCKLFLDKPRNKILGNQPTNKLSCNKTRNKLHCSESRNKIHCSESRNKMHFSESRNKMHCDFVNKITRLQGLICEGAFK